jgi:general secretion pathway protein G
MQRADRRNGRSIGRGRGFTLIELVITLALLGLLAMLAAPMTEVAVQRSKEQSLRSALREIRDAIDHYRAAADKGRITRRIGDSGYPPSLEVLVTGVPDASDPKGGRLYFLRRLPRDPFATDAQLPAAQTWGLRTYVSAPDDPQSGDDVFDVYSRAEGNALDGSAYRDW